MISFFVENERDDLPAVFDLGEGEEIVTPDLFGPAVEFPMNANMSQAVVDSPFPSQRLLGEWHRTGRVCLALRIEEFSQIERPSRLKPHPRVRMKAAPVRVDLLA